MFQRQFQKISFLKDCEHEIKTFIKGESEIWTFGRANWTLETFILVLDYLNDE